MAAEKNGRAKLLTSMDGKKHRQEDGARDKIYSLKNAPSDLFPPIRTHLLIVTTSLMVVGLSGANNWGPCL
jgi:hypothetical protein